MASVTSTPLRVEEKKIRQKTCSGKGWRTKFKLNLAKDTNCKKIGLEMSESNMMKERKGYERNGNMLLFSKAVM